METVEISPIHDFNIDLVKRYIERTPSEAEGWKLEYEGHVTEDKEKNPIKVFRMPSANDSEVQMELNCSLSGVKAENLWTMLKDIAFRDKLGRPPKVMEVVEQTSDNSDYIYFEIDLPSPLTNRDFVQKRLYFGNKQHPDIVDELNFYKFDHEYYIIIVESTERPEYPEKDKPVRGETIMNYTWIEEDPKNKGVVNVRLLFHQKLNGNVPKGVLGKAVSQMPCKMMTALLDCHKKYFETNFEQEKEEPKEMEESSE